ncbi:MAG: hypothetical protein ACRDDY_13985 [Clostridium sp.]|uniref:hypothetical protein n=1 Tax=Clostridium sp. TaxID=1506 RepID=UPI003EE56825
MITIDVSTATHRGGSFDPSFKLIRTAVNKNVSYNIRTRRLAADMLPPDHLLITILNSLSINRNDSLEEMYYKLRDRVYMLGTALGLVSPTSYGKSHRHFMMDGCNEYIYLHCDDFVREAWQNISPIEFVYHEETNLNTLYGGHRNEDTYALISINVFALAYQFKCWLRQRTLDGSTETIRSFLHKFPVTNAIHSYTDISLFNRHLYTQQGWDMTPDKKYHLTTLMSFDSLLEKHIRNLLEKLGGQTHTISQNLYGTELFYKLSALDLIPTVPAMRSRQTGWFFDLAKLPLILYGDTFMRNTNEDYNKGQLSTWRRELTQTIDSHIWSILQNAAPHIKERYRLFFKR